MTTDKYETAQGYINRIRNKAKQEYARAYWSYRVFNGEKPSEPRFDCSYMAKQSVRIHLQGIIDRTLGL